MLIKLRPFNLRWCSLPFFTFGRWPCSILANGRAYSTMISPCASRCPTKEVNYFLLGVLQFYLLLLVHYIWAAHHCGPWLYAKHINWIRTLLLLLVNIIIIIFLLPCAFFFNQNETKCANVFLMTLFIGRIINLKFTCRQTGMQAWMGPVQASFHICSIGFEHDQRPTVAANVNLSNQNMFIFSLFYVHRLNLGFC